MTKPGLPYEERPADAATIDGMVKALYESISFAPHTQPDYDRLRSLFHVNGHLIPAKAEKESPFTIMDVETFITHSREQVVIGGLERRGFVETEVARRMQSFGSIVHLFSTYESRYASTDPDPLQRGINSIQLVREHGRWWIVSILWEVERPGSQIPRAYLT